MTQNLEILPDNIDEAIKLAEKSQFVKNIIGADMLDKYLVFKKQEARLWLEAKNKEEFYIENYFRFV